MNKNMKANIFFKGYATEEMNTTLVEVIVMKNAEDLTKPVQL